MPDMHTLSVIRQDWMRSIRGFDGLDMLHHMYFCVSLQSTSCLIDDGIQRNGWSRNVQKGPSVHSWLCIAFFLVTQATQVPRKLLPFHLARCVLVCIQPGQNPRPICVRFFKRFIPHRAGRTLRITVSHATTVCVVLHLFTLSWVVTQHKNQHASLVSSPWLSPTADQQLG